MLNNRYYTGIGSRKTPDSICLLMTKIASLMSKKGFILRSGGANGADSAFELGSLKSDIFLPWKEFNGSNSKYYCPTSHAYDILESVLDPKHYRALNYTTRHLHARNVHQVLGIDCTTPSEALICWTEGGKEVGGTATAMKVAKRYNVKIYNLADQKTYEYFKKLTDRR